jgi:hypothetical protein
MNYEKIQFEREKIDVVRSSYINFGINLKEVIDRFIWTIELCHI